ncbi:MAG: ArsR/SmtB family transcription factor [Pseudomonadales bacterium]
MTRQSALPDVCEASLQQSLRPDLFKALCDPIRISIVATLAARKDAATVSEIKGCCDIDFSGVSRHLKLLRDAGIVEAEKHGREVRYSLDSRHLAATLRSVADAIESC